MATEMGLLNCSGQPPKGARDQREDGGWLCWGCIGLDSLDSGVLQLHPSGSQKSGSHSPGSSQVVRANLGLSP